MYLLRYIDEMVIKISERTFFDCTFLELTDFVRLKWCSLVKGGSNLFDLLSYSTYPKFDLSGSIFCTKSIPQPREMIKCSRQEEFDLTSGRLIEA